MARNMNQVAMNVFIPILILFATYNVVTSDDNDPIPQSRNDISTWFQKNVLSLSARKSSLDPALVAAESEATLIKVSQDGNGDFKTITEAVNSVPTGNKKRFVIYIAGGTYNERVRVDWKRPFITLYGNPNAVPKLVSGGTAAKYGTDDSATLVVESDYFVAANLHIMNSAPRPKGNAKGQQAVAFRIAGDKAAIYNCKLQGFQDTVGDDHGRHFFKDSYIEGTIDFIFGDGRSLYLNTELHVISGDNIAVVTAQAGQSKADIGGFSFVHCQVTGTGDFAFLGRAWMPYAKVVFAYSDMTDVVHPEGWSNNFKSENDNTVSFGEYQNKGTGADSSKRIKFTKNLSAAEVKSYLTLGYIEGSKWLLPPPSINGLKGKGSS